MDWQTPLQWLGMGFFGGLGWLMIHLLWGLIVKR